MIIKHVFLLSVAGALGTVCRYGMTGLVQRMAGAAFPWGTLAVNITGCFLAGAAWSFFENRLSIDGQSRIIVMVGFMGAFTTFSSYLLETSELLRASEWIPAAGNLILQNGIGFAALLAGINLVRLF